ncbi:hypothetical protein MLD38_021999 [Melastoma candidum]|uniref:Uncharacterized protein n=1 Tax=Melastoma candidum TaxID=119954 RepID=A0ACB9QHY2_9MYRT|nr:hypothetical protein MLD38_021999 [Melastoma candidum]
MALTSMMAALKRCATHVGIIVVPGRPFSSKTRYINRNLRSRRRHKHALEYVLSVGSEWMSENHPNQITTSYRAVQLDLIGKVRGLDAAERYSAGLSEQDRGDKTYGALLN